MSPDEDAMLMQQLKDGHDTALNDLMARWQTPLVAFLFRYTGNHDDALDLAQETFARVYEHRHRYEPRARFSGWLFTIASNLSRNHARWKQRHPTVSLQAPQDEEGVPNAGLDARLADGGATPFDSADRSDLAGAVRTQIGRLPDDMRRAVLLSEYGDLSHAEIGAVLGCTAKAVEVRLYRAREILRKALSAWQRR